MLSRRGFKHEMEKFSKKSVVSVKSVSKAGQLDHDRELFDGAYCTVQVNKPYAAYGRPYNREQKDGG